MTDDSGLVVEESGGRWQLAGEGIGMDEVATRVMLRVLAASKDDHA